MISKQAKLIQTVLRCAGMRKISSNKMLNPARSGRYTEPPKSFYKKYDISVYTKSGVKCVNLKSGSPPIKHIVYFHGGGYASETSKMHWNFAEYLLKETMSEVTLVNYPLSPEHSCSECIEAVTEIYKDMFAAYEGEIILAGDSAGGGLALALAQNINYEGISAKPDKIVLLSPWIDVSMSDDVPQEVAGSDVILEVESLKTLGKRYAKDLDLKDFRCSPLYGDLSGVGETALFIGTHDVLYPQAKSLKDKMSGIAYYEYEGMMHDWMLVGIPEAVDAKKKIAEFIRK